MEDRNQLNERQLIEMAFESTKYDSWANQDPLTAKEAAAKEYSQIKQNQDERNKAAKRDSEENQRREIERLKAIEEEHQKMKEKMETHTRKNARAEDE